MGMDAAAHRKMRRRAIPHFAKQNYPVQNVNSAEVKKLCSKRRQRKEGCGGAFSLTGIL